MKSKAFVTTVLLVLIAMVVLSGVIGLRKRSEVFAATTITAGTSGAALTH